MKIFKVPWQLLLVWLAAVIVFFPTMSTYFLQDDWTFLSYVLDKPFWDIFLYHSRSIYRPIGQQLFFWIGARTFGLNSIGFHLLGMGIHWLNIGLLWRLLSRWPKSRPVIVLWYAIHPVHFVPLNWLTQIDLEVAVTWSLLAILAVRRWSTKWLGWLAGLGSYTAALLSHEVALLIPVVIGVIQRRGRYVWWLAIGLLIVGIKYLINPFPLDEDYQVSVSAAAIFSQVKWYIWRGMGVIEGFRAFPWWVSASSLLFPLLTILWFRWRVVPALGIFLFGVAPMLAFSQHPMSAYATVGIALVSLWLGHDLRGIGVDTILTQYPEDGKQPTGIPSSGVPATVLRSPSFVLRTFVALLLEASAVVVIWSVAPAHWTTTRAAMSEIVTERYKYVDDLGASSIHLVGPLGSDSREVYFATLEGNQLRVLTGNPELMVTFEAFEPAPAGAPVIKL